MSVLHQTCWLTVEINTKLRPRRPADTVEPDSTNQIRYLNTLPNALMYDTKSLRNLIHESTEPRYCRQTEFRDYNSAQEKLNIP